MGLEDEDRDDKKGRKTLIQEYMNEHRDSNELAVYTSESEYTEGKSYKGEIEKLGLVIPTVNKLDI